MMCDGGIFHIKGALNSLKLERIEIIDVGNANFGGALFVDLSSTSQSHVISSVVFQKCEARCGGAAYFANYGISFKNCKFIMNLALLKGQDIYHLLPSTSSFYTSTTIVGCCSTGGDVPFNVSDGSHSEVNNLFSSCITSEYYVQSGGNNANSCTSSLAPCATLVGVLQKTPNTFKSVTVLGVTFVSNGIDFSNNSLKVSGSKNIFSFASNPNSHFFLVTTGRIELSNFDIQHRPNNAYAFFKLTGIGQVIVRESTVKCASANVCYYSFAVLESGSIMFDKTNISNFSFSETACFITVLNSVTISLRRVIVKNFTSSKNSAIISDFDASVLCVLNIQVTSSTFSNISCSASLNGGLFTFQGSSGSCFSFTNSSFENVNSGASGSGVVGGGVFFKVALSIFLSSCSFDSVGEGLIGGAVSIDDCMDIHISLTSFTNCSASRAGGGVFFGPHTWFNITSTNFSQCKCLTAGGAIFSASQAPGVRYLQNVHFTQNSVVNLKSNDIADNNTNPLMLYNAESVRDCSSTSFPFKFYFLQIDIYRDCLLEV
jgi:hypothetical protein